MKHYVVTSPLAGPSKWLSSLMSKPSEWRYPELRALFAEDQTLFAVLPKLVASDARCLDVGAHIGSFAYRLQKLTPQGTVTMIEALPRKAAMLRRRFPKCDVHEVAVSDTDSTTTFYENLDQSGFSSLANRASRGETVAREVAVAQIDTLLPDAHVDFIKIDVEGFELPALQGACALITRCQPTILFEAGATIDSDLEGAQGDGLFELLTQKHGYQIWSVAGFATGEAPLDLTAYRHCRTYPFMAFNFLAIPPRDNHGLNPNEVIQ